MVFRSFTTSPGANFLSARINRFAAKRCNNHRICVWIKRLDDCLTITVATVLQYLVSTDRHLVFVTWKTQRFRCRCVCCAVLFGGGRNADEQRFDCIAVYALYNNRIPLRLVEMDSLGVAASSVGDDIQLNLQRLALCVRLSRRHSGSNDDAATRSVGGILHQPQSRVAGLLTLSNFERVWIMACAK